MSQSIGIIWESSGTFGYRTWSSDYIPYVLDQLNQIARQHNLQELGSWIIEEEEELEEMLEACIESLETADTLYLDSSEREEFQRNVLKTMQDLERRLQQIETQDQWHNPGDAIGTIHRLVIYLRENPGTLFDAPINGSYLIEELERLEQLLIDAEQDGIRFAFKVG